MKVNENFKSQHLSYLKSYLPEEITKSAEFQRAVLADLEELFPRSIHKTICLGLFQRTLFKHKA